MNYKIYDQLPQEEKKIRIKVFMEEQGFKDEFDDLDEVCKHLVVFDHQKAIGTCRYYYDDPLQANVIGRIMNIFHAIFPGKSISRMEMSGII